MNTTGAVHGGLKDEHDRGRFILILHDTDAFFLLRQNFFFFSLFRAPLSRFTFSVL